MCRLRSADVRGIRLTERFVAVGFDVAFRDLDTKDVADLVNAELSAVGVGHAQADVRAGKMFAGGCTRRIGGFDCLGVVDGGDRGPQRGDGVRVARFPGSDEVFARCRAKLTGLLCHSCRLTGRFS